MLALMYRRYNCFMIDSEERHGMRVGGVCVKGCAPEKYVCIVNKKHRRRNVENQDQPSGCILFAGDRVYHRSTFVL